jgi:hypothetical protein
MSAWKNIPKQKMSSDMPDEFVGEVSKVSQSVNKSGFPVLVLNIRTVDGTELITNFKIPKAWTGKGQADLLKLNIEKLGFSDPAELAGHVFRWKRMQLEGSMKGFDRHYPIAEIKGKLVK